MGNYFFHYCIRFLLIGIAFCSFSFYSQERDSTVTISLNEVLLEQDRNLTKTHASPVPVQFISGKSLQRLSSYNVADAIRFFSGVQLKDYGGVGGLKTINVRSMGSQHTGVFYDGIQLSNAQNGQVDLGKFSLDNMETVALYHGQRSDLDQSAKAYASANSIYLKTKAPEFESSKKVQSGFKYKTGSFGLLNPSAYLDYKINDVLSARVSLEYLNADGEYKFRFTNGVYDTTAVRKNADIRSYRLETSLYGRHGTSAKWNVKYYHFDSERGLPGAIVANRFKRPQRLWDRSSFVQGAYTQYINNRYFLVFRGKYGNNYSRYIDPEIITTAGVLENNYKQEEYYFSMVNTYQLFPFWRISLATDFQNNTMEANLYRFPYPRRYTLLTALTTDFYFSRIHLQANMLRTKVDESVEFYEAARDHYKLTPSVMLNWQPFEKDRLRIRGFYKKIFRMPTFNDLYYTFIGNTFLKPEYATQINIGFSYQTPQQPIKIGIEADVYRAWITDKIVAVPGANLFRWTMLNLGKVQTTGLETNIKVSGKSGRDFQYSTNLSYTYQKSIDITANGSNYKDQIPYIPLHSGSLSAQVDYRKLELNYSFIYTGERYSQKANISSNYLQPWYTSDLGMAYTFTLNRNPLKIGLETNNIFNQQYAVIKNFPMPGRSYRFTLCYDL